MTQRMPVNVAIQPWTAIRLRRLEATLRGRGNEAAAVTAGDLATRVEQSGNAVRIVFCGLFSAGKSSLLNHLTGVHHFATGAVPTTSGRDELPLPDTADGVRLVDTPGIDSTEDAHRQVTEAALRGADIVVLVVDYQHVESEGNLALARSLSAQGKRLWLVVHQIDKHLEWELPFTDFRRSVERAFEDWDVRCERVYYTSTDEVAQNELTLLRTALSALAADLESVITASIHRQLYELAATCADGALAEQRMEVEARLVALLGAVPFDRAEAEQWWQARDQQWTQQNEQLAAAAAQRAAQVVQLRTDCQRLIELAQISPYETTERGRQYVESLLPSFKVGWLASARKTAEARRDRLQSFQTDLAERTRTFLVWPLQNLLREFAQRCTWADPTWQTRVADVDVDVTDDLCVAAVKHGALDSQTYPYQYVKDVVATIKRTLGGRLTQELDGWFKFAPSTSNDGPDGVLQEMHALTAWMDWHATHADCVTALLNGDDIQ